MAIAAARRRLPMIEVDAATPLIGANGPVTLLDAFEGRSQLYASYHIAAPWPPPPPTSARAAFNTGHVLRLSYLHSRDVTFAKWCSARGPFGEIDRYREFMGWEMPWYAVPEGSLDRIAPGGPLRHEGVLPARGRPRLRDLLDHRARCDDGQPYQMLDMTVYGRQESWEESPEGWPRRFDTSRGGNAFRLDGRPISQWSRIAAGRSDDLGTSAAGIEHRCH